MFQVGSDNTSGRVPWRWRVGGGVALTASLLLVITACGNSEGGSAGSTGASVQQSNTATGSPAATFKLTPPPDIKSSGLFKICADIVYPPYTFKKDNQTVGIDADVANTLAKAMGVTVQWEQTAFPDIVGALQGSKCDAIINGINGTAAHAKVIAQVSYLQDTKGFITKKGNPEHISTLNDLAGKTVATQLGSSTATYLEGLNKTFESEGKTPLKITTLPQDTAAFSAVLTGRVDTYFQDLPVLGYYARNYSQVTVLPISVNPQTNVVGIRKNDSALIAAVNDGVNQMYKLGIMQSIAKKWGDPASNLLPNMPGPTS